MHLLYQVCDGICGRQRAATSLAADLARDQRALDRQLRDIRQDRRDYRDRW
jgi:hypothetical protein